MMSLALTVLAAIFAPPAFAHPGGHDGGQDGGDEYRSPVAAPAPVVLVIPETLPALATALRDRVTAAETALAGLKISDHHRECTTIKSLAAAAPSRALTLPAGEQATIASTATHLQAQSDALVSTATKNDATGAKTAISAMRADIDTLAGLAK